MTVITVSSSFQILVVVLTLLLLLFLTLSIVAIVKIIQILKHIKAIVEKAEDIADKAEAVGEFFQKTAGPVAIAKLVSNIAESVFNRNKSKKE
jgi:hypothetical protein